MANGNAGGMRYTLTFINNSPEAGDVCVYQSDPDIGNPNVMSLAWFTAPVAVNANIAFHWQVEYSFVWDQTDTLRPGVTFEASEVQPADLSNTNQITFTKEQPIGDFAFQDQRQGSQPGTLYIVQDRTIPANQLSCGIGMSGSGIYAVQAEPNVTTEFTPHPVYWITFGSHSQGQVLDFTTITNPAKIEFLPNVYAMTATLNKENQWVIK